MSVTPKAITGAQLTASAATYYGPVAANTKAMIKKLTFTNTDTSARTVTVYLVPSGGTAGATNILISARSIAAGEAYDCYEAMGQVLAAGGFLQALADVTTKVTINGAVAEVV